jgi:hypothetical protein
MLAAAFATNKGGVTGPAKFAIDDESIRLQGTGLRVVDGEIAILRQ